jgi:hypothetical protein
VRPRGRFVFDPTRRIVLCGGQRGRSIMVRRSLMQQPPRPAEAGLAPSPGIQDSVEVVAHSQEISTLRPQDRFGDRLSETSPNGRIIESAVEVGLKRLGFRRLRIEIFLDQGCGLCGRTEHGGPPVCPSKKKRSGAYERSQATPRAARMERPPPRGILAGSKKEGARPAHHGGDTPPFPPATICSTFVR